MNKRPRIVVKKEASYSLQKGMERFKDNLEYSKDVMTPKLYGYLKDCNDPELIVAAIKDELDINGWVEKLDWLYSTFYTYSVVHTYRPRIFSKN
jgi:hypothetical protein